ncbi:MAG: hypothetical protein VW454_06810 [Pelagibacteraceae bacterium]
MMENQEPIDQLRTNHNIRLVILDTKETILCLFGEIPDSEKKTVIGYRVMYPFVLSLGTANEDGTIPISYTRWCPYTPVQEFKMTGDHIISVTYPDNNIVDNYVSELAQYGITEDQLFYKEEVNGDQRELVEAAE